MARTSSTGEVYRAAIRSVAEGKVIIRALDSGHCEVKSQGDIFELPTKYMEEPPAVIELWPARSYERSERKEILKKFSGKNISVKVSLLRGKEVATFFQNGMEISLTDLENVNVLGKENLSVAKKVQALEEKSRNKIVDLRSGLNRTSDVSSSCRGAIAKTFVNESSMMVESLREEEQYHELNVEPEKSKKTLSFVMVDEPPTAEEKREEQVPVLSPRLRPSHGSRWRVGDQVVAYWPQHRCWRAGVIHELDRSSALVVAADSELRPEYIDFSLIKPGCMPLEALNKFEFDVSVLPPKQSSVETERKEEKEEAGLEDPAETVTAASVTMSPSLVFSSSPEQFCKFARSGAGSRFLQSLVGGHNTRLCHNMLNLLLSSESNLRMMTNARACFVFQKLLMHLDILPAEQQERLLAEVDTHFSRLAADQFGYHIAQTAVTHLAPDLRRRFVTKLENKAAVLAMIRSPHGTFVAQASVPFLPASTVTFVVNSVLGHTASLCQDKHGGFFMQTFLAHWGHLPALNLLVEDITTHLRGIIHHTTGVKTVQTLARVRGDHLTMARIVDWITGQIEAVYRDHVAIRAVGTIVKEIVGKIRESREVRWAELLDKLVFKLLIGRNSEGRCHAVAAACHEAGHLLVAALVKNSAWLSTEVRRNLRDTINSYRTVLSADKVGCAVLKLVQAID